MQKNDIFTDVITSIGSNCEGIVKRENIVCFIPFALLKEKVKYKVLKVKGNVAYCKLIEVLTPAEERVRVSCPVYNKCGGCQLLHSKYSNQIKIKRNTVKDLLKKIANINFEVNKVVESPCTFNYRNKLQLPVRETENGIEIGFFRENSHDIVAIENCLIQQAPVNRIISIFKDFIAKYKINCYNEKTESGLLKHIVVRTLEYSTIFVIVINGKELPFVNELIKLLQNEFEDFSLYINVNELNNNVVLLNDFRLLYGRGVYYQEEFGIRYPVMAQSFMQINDGVRQKLYADVVKSIELDENTVVIDAYSGAGIMTAMLATNAKKAIGIEIIKEAVESADILKRNNGLSNKMTNYVGKCEELLPEIIKKETESGNKVKVVVDPPRKGCDIKVLEALLISQPEKIVYVSCSPQTLSRDLGILTGTLKYENGELKKQLEPSGIYEIEKITPYDMFPQTKHVETLCVLERINHNI